MKCKDNVNQYDTQTGERGLFVEYTNIFLKLKAEVCGYPNSDRNPEDEDHYIQNFM
jgi:hypothetical protein